jgi:hypothetical protein
MFIYKIRYLKAPKKKGAPCQCQLEEATGMQKRPKAHQEKERRAFPKSHRTPYLAQVYKVNKPKLELGSANKAECSLVLRLFLFFNALLKSPGGGFTGL